METLNPIDLTKLLKKEYVGKWVALSEDFKELIAVGDSLKKVAKDASAKGFSHPVLHKVLPFDQGFIPSIR